MPTDSLHIQQAATELNDILQGGRIDKITMPEPDEIVLFVHSMTRRAVILSANTSLPRIHITAYPPKKNPLTAPAFLMHLRKHIGGAVIKKVRSHPGERIVFFDLSARNELGYEEQKTLVCEIMGKYANIILTDGEGKISECIKHISPASSEIRPVLPGLTYALPPKQDKIDIFDVTALTALLKNFQGGRLDGYILAGAAGLAPITISAIVANVLGNNYSDGLSEKELHKLAEAFSTKKLLGDVRPCIRHDLNGKSDFWLAPFCRDGEYKFFPTLNQAMDEHFFALDRDKRLLEKAHVPKTAVKNAVARTEKKLKLFEERRSEAADADNDRLCGELIISNIYRIKQGMRSFEAENYYDDPPSVVNIRLQENKSPQYNAQTYFKKYSKKKKTLSMIDEQIKKATADLEYYNSIYDSFSYTDEDGLEEIIGELYAEGLMREPKGNRKNKKSDRAGGGETVYKNCIIRWGKTNTQNDRVTKQAKSDDMWLHTQKIHGSHVLVSGQNIDDDVIVRAAQIAAYYSKAKMSDNVPVDYTLKKFVSKPKGSPPGKMVYTDYKTIYVTPKDERQ